MANELKVIVRLSDGAEFTYYVSVKCWLQDLRSHLEHVMLADGLQYRQYEIVSATIVFE